MLAMRYKCTVAYVGTAYAGFQSQKNAPTIQDEIERALAQIFQESIRIIGASRTDQGVHAYGQVFHFDAKEMEMWRLQRALNSLLPKTIRIQNVQKVGKDFHARFSVLEKTYLYVINTGPYDPFMQDRAYQRNYPLDCAKMKEVANLYIGTHDFGSFNTAPYALYPDQVRCIRECKVIQKGSRYIIEVTGNGFLRHMVRIMVGTMVDVARGHSTVSEVEEMLRHPTKSKRRYNIDAGGLYLLKICYAKEKAE